MTETTSTTDIDLPVIEKRPKRLGFTRTVITVLTALALLLAGWYLGVQSHSPADSGAASSTAALAPDEIAKRIEADKVELVYTEDPNLNCAAKPSASGVVGKGGCVYMGTTPERIYLSPDMSDNQHAYVLIHEYAHILQGRGAWPVGGASATGMGTLDSECWADIYASSEGVPFSQLHYLPTCEMPGATSRPPAT